MSSNTVYFITGANRGIGHALVETFLSRPTSTVIAAVRDPLSSTSESLKSIEVGGGSMLILVKIDSSSETDAAEAVELLKSQHAISKFDVVISNAGIANYWGPALATPIKAIREHLEVNTIGPLILFQAVASLLEASSSPKFFVISSSIGSIGAMERKPLPGTAYGASKAAINYIIRKIHFEHPKLTAIALHPGWVQTDMGRSVAIANGKSAPILTLKDSVAGLVGHIDTATKETSGTFATYNNAPLEW